MQVAGVADLVGGECGEVGAGDREAELVGAEESRADVAFGRTVLGAMNRTMVQSSPESLIGPNMPMISS
ncbi:hypothetical protein [Nocardia grenadensis]